VVLQDAENGGNEVVLQDAGGGLRVMRWYSKMQGVGLMRYSQQAGRSLSGVEYSFVFLFMCCGTS